MTRFLFVSVFLLPSIFFTGLFPGPVKADRSPDQKTQSASYAISIQDTDTASIVYRFTVTDSLLEMSRFGAGQLEKGWATFVRSPRVISDTGQEIPIEALDGGRWLIRANKGTVASLRYKVILDHENYEWSGGIDGVAYKKEYGVFYTGRSLFIMNGIGAEDIEVSFDVPNDWRVTTVWDKASPEANSFRVRSYSELAESMLFAGVHERFTLERNGFELLFALGGEELISKRDDYEALARGVLDYYIELMGGVPNPDPENPFHRALVILNPAPQPDGEVIGNSISILEAQQGDAMSQMFSRFSFAHEIFHLWNGKSFYPSDERCEWFKEGVTNYYTLKALHQSGMLPEDSYFNVLNSFFYKRYMSDPGVGNISMTQGNEKHRHWGLIYSGGMFAGMSQDLIVRSSTSNEKSLDDLMRTLFINYGGSNRSYTLEDLKDGLTQLSGADQSHFFDSYIIGHERIPLEECLRLSGLDVEMSETKLRVGRSQEETPLEREMVAGILGSN